MKVLDIRNARVRPFEEREMNVLHVSDDFRMRIIEIPANGGIPPCKMASHVIFYVVEGKVEVTVNEERSSIVEGQCLVSEPATISMRSVTGAKLMGIQIDAMKKGA